MSKKVLELQNLLTQDDPAKFVAYTWDLYNTQRQEKLNDWLELRNYIFATDTRTTSNSTLPWKNSTTIPKLCQIRDNLHSNYISALFPNDNWLSWEAYTKEAAARKKSESIRAYMDNKCRESHFRTEISKLVYDYIDYGNCFATVAFEHSEKTLADGSKVINYSGPKLVRISPEQIVFNPTAPDFYSSWKVIRKVMTIGEVAKLAQDEPENTYWSKALAKRIDLQKRMGGFSKDDFNKAQAYQVDGFGNLQEYLQSNYMEVLYFYGDYFDSETMTLHENKVITVVDRSVMVQMEDQPTWFGTAPIYHAGWRFRQDNLWAMGPLDNLVGMQYRIDHLENLKADAQDLVVHPPLKIIGQVEEFEWGPGVEVHLDEGGDVQEISKNLQGILSADNQIQQLEDRMELYAGAPREAMGIRTPGEKTAFEVQQLNNAAGRIFQEKTTLFETELLEPILNAMLETAVRNMTTADVIRILDNDLGVQEFRTISKEDITANGKLRPVGARHFAKQAQDLQNLTGIFSSPIGQMILPHTSGKEMANVISDVLGLRGYDLFRPNVQVVEQAETQQLVNQVQEDQQVAQQMPAEGMAP